MDAQPRLSPDARAALEALPFTAAVSPDDIAAMRNAATPAVPLSDAVERTDISVPGASGDPDVAIRIHRPKGVAGPLPCVYSMHGGGYIAGTHSSEDIRFDTWCPRMGYIGVAVDYRLAPETPYPGPLEDCYAGLRWVYENADELGIDTSRIGIQGFSAGGGLAAGLALLARDREAVPIAFQLLVYPMIDDTMSTPTSQWDVPIWPPASNRLGWSSYLGDLYGTRAVPSYAAAARATDLTGLPPTFVCVGAVDGFCDENIIYAQRLSQAGVAVELHVYPGVPHGFDGMLPDLAIAKRARRDQRAWLADQLARS